MIPVSTSGGKYDVQMGGPFDEMLQSVLAVPKRVSKTVAIVDSVLATAVCDRLAPSTAIIQMDGSESAKTRKSKALVEDQLLAMGCDKDCVLIAIGGGSIGDLVGFVASTYLRGIRFIQVPTTLLAMVDSSVGGKTAVNTDNGKNMIGAFHQPIAVLIDFAFLETLSDRLFSNGLAEVIKAAFVGQPALWEVLVNVESIQALRQSPHLLESIITEAIEYKRNIVEADERDKGIRNELNFGHTIGHAIEMLDDCELLHGECVAIGMVYELMCLRAISFLESDTIIVQLISVLTKFGLPTTLPPYLISAASIERVKLFLLADKKSTVNAGPDMWVPIVALKRIGEALGGNRIVQVRLGDVMRVICPFVQVKRITSASPSSVSLPGSKSVANRALLLAAMTGEACEVSNVPSSADVHIMIDALRVIGFAPAVRGDTVTLATPGNLLKGHGSITFVSVGNSGTTARFLLPFAALLLSQPRHKGKSISFTCDERMSERPVKDLLDCLSHAFPGLEVIAHKSAHSFPLTLRFTGSSPISVARIAIDGSLSSQFVSGLLMMAPLYGSQLTISVVGLKANGEAVSQPFIDMTVRMVQLFGGKVSKVSNGEYSCVGDGYSCVSRYAIPGDASAATYPLAIAAVTGRTVEVNIADDGLQHDFEFVRLLERMGCAVQYGDGFTSVTGPARLTPPGSVDMSNMTDTFLTAAVVMAVAGGGEVTNISNQRVKECDRITAMAVNLSKCGFHVTESPDGLSFSPAEIDSRSLIQPAIVQTWNDHRVAMSMAVLSTCIDKPIFIESPRCVEKTFPTFWDSLVNDLSLPVDGICMQNACTRFSVALVGMRGIGKSTIGKEASGRLGLKFVDLDAYIESSRRMSIADIIASSGWEGFRAIETMAFKECVYEAERECVRTLIATGGGVIESPAACEILKQLERVVWLRADDEATVEAAIRASNRLPTYVSTVADVYAKRKPIYEQASSADMFVDHASVESNTASLCTILDPHTSWVPKEGSTFVCLTADSYTGWTEIDFQRAVGAEPDLVEIRVDKLVDFDGFVCGFHSLTRLVKKPIILTLRSKAEGGDFTGDKGEYASVIRRLLRLTPEWLDIEIEQHMAVKYVRELNTGFTQIIASRHYACSPGTVDLDAAVTAVMAPSWASVGKVVFHASSSADSVLLTAAVAASQSEKPLIGVCTGTWGISSRVLNKFLTPVCSSDRRRLRAAAPGQIDHYQLDLIRTGGVSGVPTRYLFHLFGDPIEKSPSPYIHNLMFAVKGLAEPCMYTAINASAVDDIVSWVRRPPFRGASVTIPLKEKVFEYIVASGGEVSTEATAAGAINTVSLTSNGTLRGDNTDIVALRNILTHSVLGRNSCLVLGTGGAARAGIVAAKSLFNTVFVFGRNSSKLDLLVGEFGVTPFTADTPVDALIGCVPSDAQKDFIAAFTDVIGSTTTVVEMAYIPRVTPLIQRAIAVNCKTVIYGAEVLLQQGIAQHAIWVSSMIARRDIDSDSLTRASVDQSLIRSQLDQYTHRTIV